MILAVRSPVLRPAGCHVRGLWYPLSWPMGRSKVLIPSTMSRLLRGTLESNRPHIGFHRRLLRHALITFAFWDDDKL